MTQVAKQATETAKQIVALREEHRSLIAEKFGNHGSKAVRLLERLYERPTVSVNVVSNLLGVSFPNANALVDKFVEHKLLFETTGQARNRVFLYFPYVNLFSNLA